MGTFLMSFQGDTIKEFQQALAATRLTASAERPMMPVTMICDRRHGVIPENN
jgi:hypothetical protein